MNSSGPNNPKPFRTEVDGNGVVRVWLRDVLIFVGIKS